MSTNSPFSPEELASFATIDTPQATNEPQAGLSREEAQALISQAQAEARQESAFLRGQLEAQRYQTSQQQQTRQEPQAPKEIPIVFNDKTEAVVPMDSLAGIIQSQVQSSLDKYHNENIAPFAPTVQSVQRQQSINQAAEAIKGLAPELLEGNDPNTVGKLAIDFYNSAFAPADDAGKQQYAVEQLRGLYGKGKSVIPMSTGSGMLQNMVPAYNQTGQTQSGGNVMNPYGYPKGATVNLEPKSINDLGGIDQYTAYAAWQNGLREYNRANNMGWKIVEKEV